MEKTEKRTYSAPALRSQKVLEKAALACSQSPYYNYLYNLKNSSSVCGYTSS